MVVVVSACTHCDGTGQEPAPTDREPGEADSAKAEVNKFKAIAQVKKAANPVWVKVYMYAIKYIAESQEIVTSDDVRLFMDDRFPQITTHENRAAGAMFTEAAKRNWIRKIGAFNSDLTDFNQGYRTIWESLLYADLAH